MKISKKEYETDSFARAHGDHWSFPQGPRTVHINSKSHSESNALLAKSKFEENVFVVRFHFYLVILALKVRFFEKAKELQFGAEPSLDGLRYKSSHCFRPRRRCPRNQRERQPLWLWLISPLFCQFCLARRLASRWTSAPIRIGKISELRRVWQRFRTPDPSQNLFILKYSILVPPKHW